MAPMHLYDGTHCNSKESFQFQTYTLLGFSSFITKKALLHLIKALKCTAAVKINVQFVKWIV